VLITWMPSHVVVPGVLVLVLFAVLLFFPVRWVLRRPWLIVANTPGNIDENQPAERWMGTVRGVVRVRQMLAKITRDIEVYSAPAVDGPLQPVD